MKRIMLLGATGSIGQQTLEIIEQYPERFELFGISAKTNIETLLAIQMRHNCNVVVMDEKYRHHFDGKFYNLDELAKCVEALPKDVVIVNALVGSVGLEPTISALRGHRDVLLANKETLVVGGEIIHPLLKRSKGRIIPIDSEHSALRECLKGRSLNDFDKVIITASGGSFRDYSREQLEDVTVEEALKHPNWSMGQKITIDSATMMNKVFEVIEAHYLFNIPYENIEVLIHKESVVHGLIYYKDGNIMTHMGPSDMRIPILTALQDDQLLAYRSFFDLAKIGRLHFKRVDAKQYPLFDLGIAVAKKKGMHVVTLNAANEAAVDLFLRKKITYLTIEKIIYDCLNRFDNNVTLTLDSVIEHDREVKKYVYEEYLGGG